MDEAQHAERRAWEVISDLCKLHSWSLYSSIYEVTEVRSELSSLLSTGPAALKVPPPPRNPWGRPGKGSNAQKRKGEQGRAKGASGGKSSSLANGFLSSTSTT